MMTTPKKASLNRPVFTQTAFDSGAMTVLTSLFHHFPEPGVFECFVRRDGRLVGRLPVRVSDQDADKQINIDMADLGQDERGCACKTKSGHALATGGVLGLYASKGAGRYTATITGLDGKDKTVLLDSAENIPGGDVFAVTLVTPGAYRAAYAGTKSYTNLSVRMPDTKDYQPDQATLVTLGKGGKCDKKEIAMFSGQSVVFHCTEPTTIRVELREPDDQARGPIRGAPFTRKKPERGAGDTEP